MGSIHQLPTAADAQYRLLQRIVKETIENHPNPAVARKWASLAKETLERYPGPPTPTNPVIDLDAIDDLTDEQRTALYSLLKTWLDSYLLDVRNQLMDVHRDLLRLQKRIAELEVQSSESIDKE